MLLHSKHVLQVARALFLSHYSSLAHSSSFIPRSFTFAWTTDCRRLHNWTCFKYVNTMTTTVEMCNKWSIELSFLTRQPFNQTQFLYAKINMFIFIILHTRALHIGDIPFLLLLLLFSFIKRNRQQTTTGHFFLSFLLRCYYYYF